MTTRDTPQSPCGDREFAPKRPENRSGLAEIAYRITTQPQSLERMAWQLPRQGVVDPDTKAMLHPLRALRTRNLSDPTISLLDAAAMAHDVLAFYSERVANEGFLQTATQRASVLELARMVGYELAPGVAASTHLAFEVESADDPYRVVEVASGVQAMSIPTRKDELPQIFETVAPITARAEWNAMPARTQRPQNLVMFVNTDDEKDVRNGELLLFDLDHSFDAAALDDNDLLTITATDELEFYYPLARRIDLPGTLAKRQDDHLTNTEIEPVLYALPVDEVRLDGMGLNLKSGQRMLAVAAQADADTVAIPLRVVSSTEDKAFRQTRVVLTRSGRAPDRVRRPPGFQLAMMVIGEMPRFTVALDRQAIDTTVRGRTWSGEGMTALVRAQAWPRAQMMALMTKILLPAPEEEDSDLDQLGLHVMRDQAGFFGAAAPLYKLVDFGERTSNPFKDWDGGSNPANANTIWMDGNQQVYSGSANVYLDREIKEIQPGGWAVLENNDAATMALKITHAAFESRADYALTGKTTGLGLATADNKNVEPPPSEDKFNQGTNSIYNNFRFRTSQLYAVSQHLPLAGVPLPQEVPQSVSALELDRLYLDLERGRAVSLTGARGDAEGLTGRETQIIAQVQHIDGVTRLIFEGEIAYPYDRTTLQINANVALANQGESVVEDLGSGDAARAHQQFVLSKPPLTFTSAANATGRATSLIVRVGGVAWDEVAALGQVGPHDAAYEVRIANDGKITVRFGDGVHGRRLPSGELNVQATYRNGIGQTGEVPGQAISQLKTKPLGVRGVTNPSPATGAADPETQALARQNAPATVKTLKRIVSLTDYTDFALGFAGVGKATARPLWSGHDKVVHLTVAPEADAELSASDPLMLNLIAAVESVRDPARRVVIQSYQRCLFAVTAELTCDPAYVPDDVQAAAYLRVADTFSYTARSLGQPVTAAEMVSVLHSVPGVVSTRLRALTVLDDGAVVPNAETGLQTVLEALPAIGPGQRQLQSGFAPAELLTVLPAAVILTASEVQDA